MSRTQVAPLASTLVSKIFSVYLALAIALTLVQVSLTYHNTYSQVLSELDSVAHAFEPGIAEALWNYQQPLIQSMAKGMVDGQGVVGVDIGDTSSRIRVTVVHGGRQLESLKVSKRLQLFRDLTPEIREPIGYMTLYSSHDVVIQRVKFGVILIFFSAIIKTAGLWLIIVFFANKLLALPLRRFTQQIGALDLANATQAPSIDLGDASSVELVYLRDAFNQMTEKVVRNEQELKQLAVDLEHRVAERTAELSKNNRTLEAEIVVRQAAEHAVARQRDFSLALINAIPEIFFLVTPGGHILTYNPNSVRALGLTVEEGSTRSVFDVVAAGHRERTEAMLNNVFLHGDSACEADLVFASNLMVPHYLVGHRVLVEDEPRAIIVGVDITARRQAEERMRHLAMHDPLTDLPNRAMLYDRLEQAISFAQRWHHSVAVLFLDLDGFKLINDQAGHDVGDFVLRQVATRLQNAIRGSDTVSRYGGDEFVIVLASVIDSRNVAPVAHKLIEAVSTPIMHKDIEYRVGASIGISCFPEHALNIDQLLEMADAAMYRAKNSGKGCFKFAEPAR